MTVPDDQDVSLRRPAEGRPDAGPLGGPPDADTVAGLLSDLDGIDRLPLAEQAARLEAVRKGLDGVLAHPAAGTSATGHG